MRDMDPERFLKEKSGGKYIGGILTTDNGDGTIIDLIVGAASGDIIGAMVKFSSGFIVVRLEEIEMVTLQ